MFLAVATSGTIAGASIHGTARILIEQPMLPPFAQFQSRVEMQKQQQSPCSTALFKGAAAGALLVSLQENGLMDFPDLERIGGSRASHTCALQPCKLNKHCTALHQAEQRSGDWRPQAIWRLKLASGPSVRQCLPKLRRRKLRDARGAAVALQPLFPFWGDMLNMYLKAPQRKQW